MVDEVGGQHLFQRGEVLLHLRLDKPTDQGFVLLFGRHRSFLLAANTHSLQRVGNIHDAIRRGPAHR
jgi:hypothetical protein